MYHLVEYFHSKLYLKKKENLYVSRALLRNDFIILSVPVIECLRYNSYWRTTFCFNLFSVKKCSCKRITRNVADLQTYASSEASQRGTRTHAPAQVPSCNLCVSTTNSCFIPAEWQTVCNNLFIGKLIRC